MYTFGYIREATKAHIDLDEQEIQAIGLHERYHIYANEAMQAICGVKPKYDYFEFKTTNIYKPLKTLGQGEFEVIDYTDIDKYTPLASELVKKEWYEDRKIFLTNEHIIMPSDFLAFAEKQAYITIDASSVLRFDTEKWVKDTGDVRREVINGEIRQKATKEHFVYTGRNKIKTFVVGTYEIPYKGLWYRFESGIGDEVVIDMPADILLTIPLYVASQCLQLDHAARAAAKRAEFEAALARCHNTDFLDLKDVWQR